MQTYNLPCTRTYGKRCDLETPWFCSAYMCSSIAHRGFALLWRGACSRMKGQRPHSCSRGEDAGTYLGHARLADGC